MQLLSEVMGHYDNTFIASVGGILHEYVIDYIFNVNNTFFIQGFVLW